MGSSRSRAWTRVACTGRRILNHCATREVPRDIFWSRVRKFWDLGLELDESRTTPRFLALAIRKMELSFMEMGKILLSFFYTLIFTENITLLLIKNTLMGDFNFHQDEITLPHETITKILWYNALQDPGHQATKDRGPWEMGNKVTLGLWPRASAWERRPGWAQQTPCIRVRVQGEHGTTCLKGDYKRGEHCTERDISWGLQPASLKYSVDKWPAQACEETTCSPGKQHLNGLEGRVRVAYKGLGIVSVLHQPDKKT